MFFAFPKLFFRSKSNNEKGEKKAKFTRLIYILFNHNCINRAEIHDKGSAQGRVGINSEHYQNVNKRSGSNNNAMVEISESGSLNVNVGVVGS